MNKIIVTGVWGQLGSAIVDLLLEAGNYVIGLDVKNDGKKSHNDLFEFHQIDITDQLRVREFYSQMMSQHPQIDGLVNNAGTAVFTKFENRSEEEIMNVIRLNMMAPIFMSQQFLNVAKSNYKSSIVNIGSIYGVTAPDQSIYSDTPRNSSEIYGMTKAAIINLTQYLAVYLSDRRIRCNCVSPGGILFKQGERFIEAYSNKVPIGRMGSEREVAAAVCFLLDAEKSSYVNGANLMVDGGFTAWR